MLGKYTMIGRGVFAANSRKKRDVSESGACKDQEQNFLQSVLNNNKSGFLNTVSIPDFICRNTLKFFKPSI